MPSHLPTRTIAVFVCTLTTAFSLIACTSSSSSDSASSSISDAKGSQSNVPAQDESSSSPGADDQHESKKPNPNDGAEGVKPNPTPGSSSTNDSVRSGQGTKEKPSGTEDGARQSTDPSQLQLMDSQTIVSSKGAVKCDVHRYRNKVKNEGEVHAVCMTRNAPKVAELPNCIPSLSQTPVIMVDKAGAKLDCTTQGSIMSNVKNLAPQGATVTINPPAPGVAIGFSELAGEVIQIKGGGRTIGLIGPGKVSLQ